MAGDRAAIRTASSSVRWQSTFDASATCFWTRGRQRNHRRCARNRQREGVALASVFQITISEVGQRSREGQSPAQIVGEIYPIIENVRKELHHRFSPSVPAAQR
jgi:hypothetical protein